MSWEFNDGRRNVGLIASVSTTKRTACPISDTSKPSQSARRRDGIVSVPPGRSDSRIFCTPGFCCTAVGSPTSLAVCLGRNVKHDKHDG